jgi:hypothetical protein
MKAIASVDLQFWVHKNTGELEYAAGLGLEGVKLGFKVLTSPSGEMQLTI